MRTEFTFISRQPPEFFLLYYLFGRKLWFFCKSTLYIKGFSSSERYSTRNMKITCIFLNLQSIFVKKVINGFFWEQVLSEYNLFPRTFLPSPYSKKMRCGPGWSEPTKLRYAPIRVSVSLKTLLWKNTDIN